MNETYSFEREHSILIDAPAQAILDYVSNPNSWPEWIMASHHIESPDRPLEKDETFYELWHTRTGEARLDWVVTDRHDPDLWVAETGTPFIGKIIATYEIAKDEESGLNKYTRRLTNPARPKPPSEDAVRRIDEEAAESLQNIKRNVESRK